jgi:hypothetical protein
MNGTTRNGRPSHDREGRPFQLVDGVERATGIEPAWPAWKAGALPLSYARMLHRSGATPAYLLLVSPLRCVVGRRWVLVVA